MTHREQPGEVTLDPMDIAGRQFATARRGFDTGEVRAYLHQISQRVAELRRREAELLARVGEAETRLADAGRLDEDRLVELLGEETARVLAASREAAAQIRSKAQEAAARLVREANDEAHQIRTEAQSQLAAQRSEMLAEAEALRQEAATELERRRADGDELVAQMVREAESECEAVRRSGDEIRQQAADDAEAIRAAAQEEGRRMVAEAQLVREKMLRDLARRRQTAREQLERLHGARDRLLAAYEVVRRTVAEATTELRVAVPEAKVAGEQAMRRVLAEPEPTVEELEAQVSMARIAGLLHPLPTTGETFAGEPDEGGDADGERAGSGGERGRSGGAGAGDGGVGAGGGPGPADAVEDAAGGAGPADAVGGAAAEDGAAPEVAAEVAAIEDGAGPADAVEDAAGGAGPADAVGGAAVEDGAGGAAPEHGGAVWAEPVVTPEVELDPAATRPLQPSPVLTGDEDLEVEPAPTDVDELFARLRQGQSEAAAAAAAPAVGPGDAGVEAAGDRGEVDPAAGRSGAVGAPPDLDAGMLRERDEALTPIERDMGRLLKRALADEQNEVLDLLRRAKPASVADVLPGLAEHAERYADAARDELEAAAGYGALHIAEVEEPPSGGLCDALAAELGQTVVEPLRERIERSFADNGGDLGEITSRIRALYREWKAQRIAEAVRHYTAAAYAQGAYAALPDGTALRWLVDRTGAPCPDADDNALARRVCKGEAFPTGDHCPPAHLGCRCLVIAEGA